MKLEHITYQRANCVPDENETTLSCFVNEVDRITELTVPEGIETICSDAFYYFPELCTVRLPRSLKTLENGLFGKQGKGQIKVIYAGGSAEFIALAKPVITQEYVPGPYDHYPYYSDSGASYRDVVSAFDTDCKDVEVYCEADGVYLYYGSKNKKPKAELPMSREEWLAREEATRKWEAALASKVLRYMKEAKTVTLAFSASAPDLFPVFDTFEIYDDKIYLAVRGHVYPYVDDCKPVPRVSLAAIAEDDYLKVEANAYCEERDEVKEFFAERFPETTGRGWVLVYLDDLFVLHYGKRGLLGRWNDFYLWQLEE